MKYAQWTLPMIAAGLLVAAGGANAGVLVAGSAFQVQATSAPDTFTNTVNLTPGNQLIDGGAVNLEIALVPVGASGAEWAVFDYTTVSGGPLSQPGADFSNYQVGLDLAVPGNFTGDYIQFTQNGTVLVPTSSFFGGSPVANPVPGGVGTGFGNVGFTDLLPAGPAPALGLSIDPFDFLSSSGINSANVNGYEQALLFAPQSPIGTPEPTSLALLVTSLLGVGALRIRNRQ